MGGGKDGGRLGKWGGSPAWRALPNDNQVDSLPLSWASRLHLSKKLWVCGGRGKGQVCGDFYPCVGGGGGGSISVPFPSRPASLWSVPFCSLLFMGIVGVCFGRTPYMHTNSSFFMYLQMHFSC